MSKLNEQTRKELSEFVYDCLRDGMFGDGQEDEYLWGGIEFKGINSMTDQELVEICESRCGGDELLAKAQAELAVHEMLTE